MQGDLEERFVIACVYVDEVHSIHILDWRAQRVCRITGSLLTRAALSNGSWHAPLWPTGLPRAKRFL